MKTKLECLNVADVPISDIPLELVLQAMEDYAKEYHKDKTSVKNVKLDFVKPEFEPVFMDWLTYKKERKESYKSARSMKMAYDKLVTLSFDNPETAKEIINQSIANNWAGLFRLKNETNRSTNRGGFESDSTRRAISNILHEINQTG